MESTLSVMRGATCAATLVLATSTPSTLVAAPEMGQCIDANETVQRQRIAGHLTAAREAAITCSQTSCPQPVVQECARWLEEIELALPRVVFLASDSQGRRLQDVSVEVDGRRVQSRLNGRSVRIDPGEHVVRFRHKDGVSVEQRQIVSEGNRVRTIQVTLPLLPPAKTEEQDGAGLHPAVLPLAGVAVVGGATFTYFALRGRQLENDLKADCAPYCKRDQAREVFGNYLVADISLGVAVGALGAMTYFLLSNGSQQERVTAAARFGRF